MAGPSTVQAPQSGGAPGADRDNLNLSTQAADLFARDRNISVSQRPHEGYQALGLRLGAFLAYPKLSVTAEHNDNIYATQNNAKTDTIWRVAPEVFVASNWSRHAVSAYARAVVNRYQKFNAENTEDYSVGASGRIDALRFTNITGAVDWSRLTEPRSSPNSPGLASAPVRYDLASATLTGQHQVNRIRLSGRYQYQDYRYDNPSRIGGGVVDQSFRDRQVNAVVARADYAVSPDTAGFVELSGDVRDYRHKSATDVDRSSKGVQALTGVNFDIGALMRGELAVGYLRQTFDDSRLRDISGVGAHAQVEWFPTQLTTVTVNGARSVQDSATPGSGGYLSTNVGAQVDHELLRNVILTARGGYGVDEYKQIARRDERTSAGVSGTYLLNHALGVTGGYSYEKNRSVRGVGNPYTDNKFTITLTAQY